MDDTPKSKKERVIEEFLAGDARADELLEMADALHKRLCGKRQEFRELPRESPEWEALKGEIKELRRQEIVLRREEAITRFVEESVAMTLAASGALEDGEGEDDFDWGPGEFGPVDEDE